MKELNRYPVSASQWRLHVTAEMIALTVIAPGLWWISRSEDISPGARSFLRATAAATVLVDGYLLYKNLYQVPRP